MRIIGIDPGVAITGYAILELKNNKIIPLNFGAIKTKKSELYLRIKEINNMLKKVIKKYKPLQACIEKVYFNKNRKTAIDVAEVRGSIILTLAENKIPVFDYTPLQIKQAVTGYGNAPKYQVKQMIKTFLNLSKPPSPDDVSDAVAVGICHINSYNFNSLIKK